MIIYCYNKAKNISDKNFPKYTDLKILKFENWGVKEEKWKFWMERAVWILIFVVFFFVFLLCNIKAEKSAKVLEENVLIFVCLVL